MAYTIKEGDYRQYGASAAGGGVVFTFEAEKEEDCSILLYGKMAESGRNLRCRKAAAEERSGQSLSRGLRQRACVIIIKSAGRS